MAPNYQHLNEAILGIAYTALVFGAAGGFGVAAWIDWTFDASTAQPATPKPVRPFQFSLGDLFLRITAIAILLSAWSTIITMIWSAGSSR